MGLRSEIEGFTLKDPSLIANEDEFGDNMPHANSAVSPDFVLQQIQNALAIRQVAAEGPASDRAELDLRSALPTTPPRCTPAGSARTISPAPAGYVSMEDGAVGGFVQRGVAAAGSERAVSKWAARAPSTREHRATEASVRGFWKCYRGHMGI